MDEKLLDAVVFKDNKQDQDKHAVVKYNKEDLKVIINMADDKEEKLNIDVLTFIKVENNQRFKFYLKMIGFFDFALYSQIAEFAEVNLKCKRTTVYEDLQNMDQLGLIATHKIGNQSYAMLTKKAYIYIWRKNDVCVKRKPTNDSFRESLYIWAMHKKLCKSEIYNAFNRPDIYCKIYSMLLDIFEPLKEKGKVNLTWEESEGVSSFYSGTSRKIDKKTVYGISGYEYCSEQKKLLVEYLSKSPEQQRNAKSDEVSTLMNSRIFTYIRKDEIREMLVEFFIFDLDRTRTWIKEQIKRIDNILANIHGQLEQKYLKADIFIMTYSQDRERVLNGIVGKIEKDFSEEREKILIKTYGQPCLELAYRANPRTTFFIRSIGVVNLDMERYFKASYEHRED